MADRPRVRVWRAAVFLLLYVAFNVCLDVQVPKMWINVPVGVAYGLFVELFALPTFGLWWLIGALRGARRELRRARQGAER